MNIVPKFKIIRVSARHEARIAIHNTIFMESALRQIPTDFM